MCRKYKRVANLCTEITQRYLVSSLQLIRTYSRGGLAELVYCTGLENPRTLIAFRRFESYSLRSLCLMFYVMIGMIYVIGVVILFGILLNDELHNYKLLRRRDLVKVIICSLGSWVVIVILGTSYLLSYCEDWLNKPLFKKK